MKNIALTLSYDGTNYHGWQSQKNAVSVSDTLLEAIRKTTGEETSLVGCGRTDAGVHAKIYVANFRTETAVPLSKLPLALNFYLPPDISVSYASAVPDSFHAIHSCRKKEYSYDIYPSKIRNPFYLNRAYQFPNALSVDSMRYAASYFCGTHDFSAVRSLGTPVKSTVRTIEWCRVEPEENGLVRISVAADGFLYNMARAIAGTLLYVGCGKLYAGEIPGILESGDRRRAGPTLPPEGLFLSRLWYDKEVSHAYGV